MLSLYLEIFILVFTISLTHQNAIINLTHHKSFTMSCKCGTVVRGIIPIFLIKLYMNIPNRFGETLSRLVYELDITT